MGTIPVPGTSWVRIPPGYCCMRTPGIPVFYQKKNFRYGFGTGRVGSSPGRAKTVPFKVNLKLKYLLPILLSHSISLLCNAVRLLLCNATAARSLSLHAARLLSTSILGKVRWVKPRKYLVALGLWAVRPI
jgi:hypothetical protein